MKRKTSRVLTMAIAIIMLVAVISGCGSTNSDNSTGTQVTAAQTSAASGSGTVEKAAANLDTSKQVELVVYELGDKFAGQDEVDDNFNKIALEKLNCTLKVNWIPWADFGNKYQLLFSSGEQFDMAYSGGWLNYSTLARKGAFMNLDELWPQYAPDNYAMQTETAKDQAKVDGHIYCIPRLYSSNSAYGISYRTDLTEKLNWNGKLDTFDDMAVYLQLIKDNCPTVEPLGVPGGSQMDDLFMYNNGIYPISGTINDFLFIDPSQDKPQLFTYYEYDKTKNFLDMMNDWNAKGFFSKSALSDTDTGKLTEGKSAVAIHNLSTHIGLCTQYPKFKFKYTNFVKDVSFLPYTQDVLVISKTSQNPERALALYNYMTTDEKPLRAFLYGIEGKSYTIHDNNQVEMLNTDKYAQSDLWSIKTKKFLLQDFGTPEDAIKLDDSITSSVVEGKGTQKYRSFVPDFTSVETELSACQNAQQQYWYPLELGYTDKVKGLQEYKEKMEAAGIDRIRKAIQEQLDNYVAGLK